MMNWASIQSARTLEVSRAFRFRPEERGVLFGALGVTEASCVVEVGCGTGVFTGYLAGGLRRGRVLGIDATPEFIACATERRLAPNLDFAVADAYALPLDDAAMDAATSYTLLGVLRDPATALREQMRVVRRGGIVSAVEVVRGRIGFAGRPRLVLTDREQNRLAELRSRWEDITRRFVESQERDRYGYGWAEQVEALPLEFERVGLKDVRLRGFLSTFSTSDRSYDGGARRWFLEEIAEHELSSVRLAWDRWRDTYERHGVSERDQRELCDLIARAEALRLRDFDEGHRAWAWHATANIVIAGTV